MRTGPSRGTRALLVVTTAAIALGLSGCGDDSDEAQPLGAKKAGSVAHLAQCRDWVGGTEDEKLATIKDIRGQVNQQSGTVQAPPLSDDEAMEVFDNACGETFAQGFRLYVLYARAAGFAPLLRD